MSFSQVSIATRLYDPRWWPGQAEPIYVTAVPREPGAKVSPALPHTGAGSWGCLDGCRSPRACRQALARPLRCSAL